MADQSSLPSIGGSDVRLSGFGGQSRPRSGWDLLGRDRLEQRGIIQPKSRLGRLYRLAREFVVVVRVEDPFVAGCACRPIRKPGLRYDVNVEQHLGKAIAAEMRRQALEGALIVGAEPQPRDHPV